MKPGDLDDIGDAPEAAAPAADAPQDAPETTSAAPEGDAPEGGDERPRKPDTRPEGYVTKGERDRIASELQQERQRAAAAEDRFAKMVERFYKENAPEETAQDDPKPDYNQDPLGYIAWKDRQETREAETRATQLKQWEQQQEEQRQFQDTLSRATARFQKVVASRPEVAETYAAVRNHVAGLYAANGVPDHQIKEMVDNYEASVIKWARQEYIPIEDALEQAAAKFGLQMPQAKPAGEQRELPPRAENGQFTEAEKAAKARESQERNTSLSQAPGAPVKKMTAAELAKMPEEEMWKHFESISGQKGSRQFDRDMGFR